MATVTNTIKLPDGTSPTHASVEISLVASESVNASEAGWVTATDVTILSTVRPTVTTGAWSADLTPNANIDPSGTVYLVREYVGRDRYEHYISVGSGGGTVHDLLTSGPSGVMFDSVTNAVAAHAALTATHGATGSVVGTTNTQTLTNKTLTDPAFTMSASVAESARSVFGTQRRLMVHASDYDTLQEAADAAVAADTPLWIDGDWTISSTLTILGSTYCNPVSVITYTGTGTAVQIGNGTVRSGLHVDLPVIECTKTWSAGDLQSKVGVLIDVLSESEVRFARIRNFSVGLLLAPSTAAGIVYNAFRGGALWDNAVNLRIAPGTLGWANSNTFQIDRYLASSSTPISGTRHIELTCDTGESFVNNNTWLQGAVEGNGVEYHIWTQFASYNLWLNMRFETASGTDGRIYFGDDGSSAPSTNNLIIGGYELVNATISESTYSRYNMVLTPGRMVSAGSETTLMRLQNGGSSAYGCVNIYDSSTPPLDAGASDWRAQLAASYFDFKGKADTYPRLRINTANSIVEFGTGATDPSTAGSTLPYLRNTSGTLAWANGALAPVTDNAVDIGTTARRVRNLFAAGYIRGGQYTTAGRPSASTAGAGATVYDTTLSKPIWSDGTVWRDAAGTSV